LLRAEQICATIISTARQCNLDKDVNLPADEDKLSLDERDLVVGNVYRCAAGEHPCAARLCAARLCAARLCC
jgi:hypothetical protein